MASKKIYAVKRGRTAGIFQTWEDCRKSVEGYAGAQYKGFPSMKEALAYMEADGKKTAKSGADNGKSAAGSGKSAVKRKAPAPDGERVIPDALDKVIAYVDGSYDHSLKKYAFGCVFILPDGTVYTESGNGDNPDSLALRNVTGEMLGSMFAVRFAMVNGFGQIEIRYDYEGIEKWVTGAWKSRTDLTQKYAAAMQGWGRAIRISFKKVAAHTNVYYNEMADRLAKGALVNGNGVPAVRRKEEMEPIGETGGSEDE